MATMMMAERNRAVIENYYQFLGDDNFDELLPLHHPDMIYAMAGQIIVSGRNKGLYPFLNHINEHVLGNLVRGGESYVKDWRICVADDEYVVGLLQGGLPNQSGGRYDQNYLQIFRLQDGIIAGVAEFFDTVMVEVGARGNALTTPRSPAAAPYHLSLTNHPPGSGDGRSSPIDFATAIGETLRAGDLPAFQALHAPDVTINVIGSTPTSGRSTGKPEFFSYELDGRLGNALTEIRFGQSFRIVCADDRAVCVMSEGEGRTPKGDHYRPQYGTLYEVRDGKAIEVHHFFDTIAFERVFFDNSLKTEPPRPTIAEPFDIMAPI